MISMPRGRVNSFQFELPLERHARFVKRTVARRLPVRRAKKLAKLNATGVQTYLAMGLHHEAQA
jgi:hypothetical protein